MRIISEKSKISNKSFMIYTMKVNQLSYFACVRFYYGTRIFSQKYLHKKGNFNPDINQLNVLL